jgi:hypothetical protein
VTIPAGVTQVNIALYGDAIDAGNPPVWTAYLDDVSLVPQIGAVALFNTNATKWDIATSLTDGAYTPVSGSPFTLTKHWDYYRTCLVRSPVMEFEYIRVQVPTTEVPNNHAAYFELGSLCFLPTLKAVEAPRIEMRETLTRAYEKSGESIAPAGPWRLQQEWQHIVASTSVQTLRDLGLLGQHTPFLLYENDVTSHCYLFRHTDDMSFTRLGLNQPVSTTARLLELV